MKERTYLAIDLKSFYASVECVERGLDPLTTNLVVADLSRTEKTICLAVTPSLKAWGISGRARLFEVVQRVKEVNAQRLRSAPGRKFSGASFSDTELKADPGLAVDYIVAPPRMAHYMEWSTRVYNVYLKYIAPEDIHNYSIDEVLMDVTNYLDTYKCNARQLAMRIILDVLETTGITATAGIGTNLYLCKVAMDIVAKHIHPDVNGVRIAKLDERTYRRLLWDHRPLTDFWRVGGGYTRKLEAHGIYTMGDIARCSLTDEDLLYRLFGVNAELLIDHAWGWEPCTMADIKAYKPESRSVGSGQVLQCPYSYDKARLVVREMADQLALDLVDKGLVTDQLVLTVGYDIENLKGRTYQGEVTKDRYGRSIPKHAHGTANLEEYTASTRRIITAALELFDRIIDRKLLVRRLYLTAARVTDEESAPGKKAVEQLDLFTDYAAKQEREAQETADLEREKKVQRTLLDIKKKYGKNAILKGMNLKEGATAKSRNEQIGGHKA
ncbi:DNA polymerase V [Oscillibacter sp. 1-3]|uniref:Y-family DNA polymerase n=1 Tax=Oscillibacter sp. 1-3 TaxID=1235797 RepID=UPI00033A0132|nr:DNA polymerase V [Oscillibacter sp. 1-3]EOS67409.1 DNA polymerase V [Oscillibacter sp. 1-3]